MDLKEAISLIISFTWSFNDQFSFSNLVALANKVLCLSFLARRNFLEASLFLILFSKASSLQELPTEEGESCDWSNSINSLFCKLAGECSRDCCSGGGFSSELCTQDIPGSGQLSPLAFKFPSPSDNSTKLPTSSLFWALPRDNAPLTGQDFWKTISLQFSPDINCSSSATWSKNSSLWSLWPQAGSIDQKLDDRSSSGLSTRCSWPFGEARWKTPVGHQNISNYHRLIKFPVILQNKF